MSQIHCTSIYLKEQDFEQLLNLTEEMSTGEAQSLIDEIEKAEIVDEPERFPKGVISMHSQVLYKELATGKKRNVILSFPEDANALQSRISVLSPVGIALLGAKQGDVVSPILHNQRQMQLKILGVKEPMSEIYDV